MLDIQILSTIYVLPYDKYIVVHHQSHRFILALVENTLKVHLKNTDMKKKRPYGTESKPRHGMFVVHCTVLAFASPDSFTQKI